LSAWFARVFDSTAELDYREALDWFGLRFAVETSQTSSKQAWLGADTKVEDGRLIIERIPRGTPAYEAGLDTGDEIVGFADFRVRPADWDRPLLLSRRGRLVRVTVKLGAEPADTWTLEAATASAHRDRW
jgi:predicted metalloprotease with PDZ domain